MKNEIDNWIENGILKLGKEEFVNKLLNVIPQNEINKIITENQHKDFTDELKWINKIESKRLKTK